MARVRATGLGTYPDLSVVGGKLEIDPEDPQGQTVTNPRLVIEVLSPSTEACDRGEKLAHYKLVETLQEVVLIAQGQSQVELWRRGPDGWSLEVVRGGQALRLRSIDCDLPVDEVYRDPLA